MIQVQALSKRFGEKVAVDDLSFSVEPGRVTGFLGPNGAGKSTTMRMVLGLDRPTSGTATVHGRAYRDLAAPLRQVGALLDAKAVDGVRTARQHLGWMTKAAALDPQRIDQVLEEVGLSDAADEKVGGFSLGMSQRLGIATALLGDPPVLLFDEPVNGLDPEGIRWVRSFMRRLADEGRTVLVSSHLMSEMETTADHVIVIGRGRLIADMPMADFTTLGSGAHVRVVTPDADRFTDQVERAGASVVTDGNVLRVAGLDNVAIAELAAAHQIILHELTPQRATLEETFMELTHDSADYVTSSPTTTPSEPSS